ncbi:BnaC01g21600D [Brassica napus]|uniref:(rape) hypothetical protein n=1 Tax=Brassica napus TaxID=3708 RepID=A0A078HCH4_BRANA|nr:unnamed protein product [Brassica napus]CDY34473.1 BnaC01g21600D [Brassica napus]
MGFNGPRHFIAERKTLMELDNIIFLLSLFFMDIWLEGLTTGLKVVLEWEPQVSQDQISLAFIAVAGGPKERFASNFVGWMVSLFLVLLLLVNNLNAYKCKTTSLHLCLIIFKTSFIELQTFKDLTVDFSIQSFFSFNLKVSFYGYFLLNKQEKLWLWTFWILGNTEPEPKLIKYPNGSKIFVFKEPNPIRTEIFRLTKQQDECQISILVAIGSEEQIQSWMNNKLGSVYLHFPLLSLYKVLNLYSNISLRCTIGWMGITVLCTPVDCLFSKVKIFYEDLFFQSHVVLWIAINFIMNHINSNNIQTCLLSLD